MGVCGRLGILKFLGPVAGDCGLTSESVLRKPTRSAPTASPILLGGDCGGSMRSEGGGTGRGLRGARPCREGDSGPPLLAPSDCRPARCSLSLGLILGTKGGFWVVVDGGGWGAGSRRPSSFGAGDTAGGAEPEGGGGGPVGVSPGLVMFSNFARSDDTGFWSCQRVWARGGGRVEGGGGGGSQSTSHQARCWPEDPWRRRPLVKFSYAVPITRAAASVAHTKPRLQRDEGKGGVGLDEVGKEEAGSDNEGVVVGRPCGDW